ncbi:hypothetical protein FACS189437_07020 [Bacteroidia bacterium]|nr:hypothetical protein FACS189437_07020 [Bacteroidia bacterium]
MLIFAMAGIASVNAQMRIGGEETPNTSAVLDLNPDDNVSAGNATLGLALPRVNLRNSGDAFPLLSHVKGMSVYNMATSGDVKTGVYVNNGAKWLRQTDSETVLSILEKDSIVGNEVTDATSGGALIRSGTGTAVSPFTLDVANSGITADKIADNAVTTRHIENRSVTMEKLSDDVMNEIMWNRHTGIMPPERPNSILVSDNNWQWRQQQIPGEQIILSYRWDTAQPAGWIDLGYALQDIPAGLYVATVQISQGNLSTSQVVVDCAVLDAGTLSAYSLTSKQMDAFNGLSFSESCLIYKLVPNNQVRLLVHTTQNTNYGLAAIILQPIIQLN